MINLMTKLIWLFICSRCFQKKFCQYTS